MMANYKLWWATENHRIAIRSLKQTKNWWSPEEKAAISTIKTKAMYAITLKWVKYQQAWEIAKRQKTRGKQKKLAGIVKKKIININECKCKCKPWKIYIYTKNVQCSGDKQSTNMGSLLQLRQHCFHFPGLLHKKKWKKNSTYNVIHEIHNKKYQLTSTLK